MNNYKFTDAQMRVINVMVTYFDELGINPKYKEDFESLCDYLQTGGELF
tara:strand:- start:300 stop:446 length:147 start_codon:yes stop_codon:yes gene_type:complete